MRNLHWQLCLKLVIPGLKILIIVQAIFICVVVAFCLCRRRVRSKRRHSRWTNLLREAKTYQQNADLYHCHKRTLPKTENPFSFLYIFSLHLRNPDHSYNFATLTLFSPLELPIPVSSPIPHKKLSSLPITNFYIQHTFPSSPFLSSRLTFSFALHGLIASQPHSALNLLFRQGIIKDTVLISVAPKYLLIVDLAILLFHCSVLLTLESGDAVICGEPRVGEKMEGALAKSGDHHQWWWNCESGYGYRQVKRFEEQPQCFLVFGDGRFLSVWKPRVGYRMNCACGGFVWRERF